jgi:hypothetical protein
MSNLNGWTITEKFGAAILDGSAVAHMKVHTFEDIINSTDPHLFFYLIEGEIHYARGFHQINTFRKLKATYENPLKTTSVFGSYDDRHPVLLPKNKGIILEYMSTY